MNAKPLLLALALSMVGSATPIKLFSGNCRADFEIGLAHNFLIARIPTTVHGNFNDFRGHIDYNPKVVESSTIDWRVNVDSINTGIAARDKHLASPDFFNAEKYPTLSFISQSVHAATMVSRLDFRPSATTFTFASTSHPRRPGFRSDSP